MDKIIDELCDLVYDLTSKSEELMIGDFKQYVDEEWLDEMCKIIDKLRKYGENNG